MTTTYLTPTGFLFDRIVSEVTTAFGVTKAQFFSPVRARQRTIVRTRNVMMWLLRAVTTLSQDEIGRRFDRDHSTVCTAVQVVNDQLKHDELLCRRVQQIADKLGIEVALPQALTAASAQR